MSKKPTANNPLRGAVNTLAQNGTEATMPPPLLVNGKGSDLRNKKAIKGRAKRKVVTQIMALSLVDVARQKGQEEWFKPLWNTYHCQNRIYTANGRLYGKYCKNRFCTLCCAIRKAEIMNKYLPVVNQWQEPYFVTLTIKAYPIKYLKKAIQKVMNGFRVLLARSKKRYQRGKDVKLVGIKSLECNYNPAKKTYNPHLHLIVQSKAVAELLINEWLLVFGTRYTNRKGQHLVPIYDKEKSLIEIVKYGSKIFTEPDIDKKREPGQRDIYAAALFNIFQAMQGQRIFERFGFNLPKEQANKETSLTHLTCHQEWVFDIKSFDWLNTHNEERLTDYTPLPTLIDLLQNRVNLKAE